MEAWMAWRSSEGEEEKGEDEGDEEAVR